MTAPPFARSMNELRSERIRLRQLASEVIRATDRERARIAHELHDSTAQRLAALVLQLSAAEREFGEPAATRFNELKQLAADLLEDVRLLAHTVYPRMLDDLGLPAALAALVREVRSRHPAVAITLVTPPRCPRLVPTLSSVLYFVAQESVSNALHHASPGSIDISLECDADEVALHVRDNGTGFDALEAERRRPGMGIFAMRERLSLVGGRLDISSSPRDGTHIIATVPHQTDSTPPSES